MENKEELQQKVDELEQKIIALEERVKILEEKYDEIEFEDDEEDDEEEDEEDDDIDSDNSIWMIKIERKKANFGFFKHFASFEKVFSTKKLAEKWLIKKGFVFGVPEIFDSDSPYWFHQLDDYKETNHVQLYKTYIDDFNEKSWVDMLFFRHLDD